jgi:predicted membrane-bound spermidine synthase
MIMNSSGRNLPNIFFPVLFLSGIASSIAMLTWFRMYTNLFGIHQFSITSVLAVIFICMAAGSRLGGRLADKNPDQVVIFVVFQGITGLYALFNPLIYSLLLWIFDSIIRDSHPLSFTMGFIRIILTFPFLFIPCASIGATVPVLSRIFTKHIVQAGNRLSLILSVLFAGISAGFIIYGFYIRETGMHRSLLLSSLLFFIASGLSILFLILEKTKGQVPGNTIMATRVRSTAMLFRKRKPVLEAGAKLTRAMIRVHAVHGFASVSLLVLASRIITEHPILSLSLVHIFILAVFFVGLATGASLYKRITGGMVNGYLLMASLEILTGFIILFSFLLFTITAPAMQAFAGINPGWGKSAACQLTAICSFILLPSIITGILLPLAARIYPRRIQHSGRNIGKLGSLFFSGAVFGIVITHYILLSFVSSFYSVFVLIGIALLSGIFLLLRDSRLIRGFRLSYTAISVACLTGILFVAVRLGWIQPGSDTRLVTEKQEGSSALVTLRNLENDRQGLYIDGVINQVIGNDQVQVLPAILSCVTGQPAKSSLVIGFGTGVTASTLEDCDIPSLFIAEVYPEVLTLSARAFSEENQDILTSSRVNIAIEDARLFLTLNGTSFDMITAGYTNFQNTPAFFTSGFYRICFAGLSNHGLLTQVLPLRGINKQEFRSLIMACIDVFPQVSLWYLSPDKVMLLASKKRHNLDYCTIAQRFASIDHFGRFSKPGIADTESLIGKRLMDDRQLRIFAEGAPANTDDHPFLEFSRTPSDFTDPELISQLINDMGNSQNPYFTDASCSYDNTEVRQRIDRAKQAIRDKLAEVLEMARKTNL